MNNKYGLIVDGDGDFASFKKVFTNGFKVLKTDGPRGHEAKTDQIILRAKKQIDILKAFKCNKVIIILDFENRNYPYEEFISDLRLTISKVNFNLQLDIAVPNKMIENWYLADIETLSTTKAFIKNNLSQKKYEGTHGKEEIKKCMTPNESYNEKKHGAQMFAAIDFNIARKNSKSFNEFLNLIE